MKKKKKKANNKKKKIIIILNTQKLYEMAVLSSTKNTLICDKWSILYAYNYISTDKRN